MNINIKSATLQEALRVIGRLAPPSSGTVTLESDGKKLYMKSDSDASRCVVLLPCEVEGKAKSFAVAFEALRDATKGRKELKLGYDKTMLKLKEGSYSVEMPTQDALVIEHDEDKAQSEPIKLDAEQVAWLKTAVNAVALKPNALMTTLMPVGIKMTDKGTFVGCFDDNHMSYIKAKGIKGNAEVTIPLDTMLSVLDTFGGSALTMTVGRVTLHVKNKLVDVHLSLPQEDEGGGQAIISLKDVIAQVKVIADLKGSELEIPKEELIAFLDNAKAVVTKELPELEVTGDGGKLTFKVTTVAGTSKQTLKVATKKPVNLRVDYTYVDEAVRRSGDVVNVKVVKDQLLAFTRKVSDLEAVTVVSLNQQ